MTNRRDPSRAASSGGVTGGHPSRRIPGPSRATRRAAAGIAFLAMLLPAVPALAAASAAVTVSAVVLVKTNCRFITSAVTLAFGDLDPANPVDVTVSAPIRFRCNGGPPTVVFLATDDDGMNETVPGGNQMRRTTPPATLLPYEFSVSPASGTIPRNTPQTLTVTGTVRGADYQAALTGDYVDTVVVSINP